MIGRSRQDDAAKGKFFFFLMLFLPLQVCLLCVLLRSSWIFLLFFRSKFRLAILVAVAAIVVTDATYAVVVDYTVVAATFVSNFDVDDA